MEPTTIEGWKVFVYDQMVIAEQCQKNIQIANQKIAELSQKPDKKVEYPDTTPIIKEENV